MSDGTSRVQTDKVISRPSTLIIAELGDCKSDKSSAYIIVLLQQHILDSDSSSSKVAGCNTFTMVMASAVGIW